MENSFITNGIGVNNEQESKILAKNIATNIKPGSVIIFNGDLGSGKSFFCREIIKFFCGDDTTVVSPTFNLLQTYECKEFIIYHYDLYRMKDIAEIYELGIEEALSNNVTLIEWPSLVIPILPKDLLNIKIDIIGKNKRFITME